MPRYSIDVPFSGSISVVIEADNEDELYDIFIDEAWAALSAMSGNEIRNSIDSGSIDDYTVYEVVDTVEDTSDYHRISGGNYVCEWPNHDAYVRRGAACQAMATWGRDVVSSEATYLCDAHYTMQVRRTLVTDDYNR